MKVDTIEFWQQVKADYDPMEHGFLICGSSATFCEAWRGFLTTDVIRHLRDDFLCEHPNELLRAGTFLADNMLFMRTQEGRRLSHERYYEEAVKIRKEFIDFCIRRYQALE